MKQTLFNVIVATALALLLTACESSEDSQSNLSGSRQNYNIVLVVDGTDKITHQHLVPDVCIRDIKVLVDSIVKNGEGTFYVTYVDENCTNNDFAMLRWKAEPRPQMLTSKDKASYEQQKVFNKRLAENKKEIEQWRIDSANLVQPFYDQCLDILSRAYSDEVTFKSKGSDVHGAVNHALNMIESSQEPGSNNYIVLVSDCDDNVGTKLDSIPSQDVKLILINGISLIPKINFDKKFVAIQQATEYMFNK